MSTSQIKGWIFFMVENIKGGEVFPLSPSAPTIISRCAPTMDTLNQKICFKRHSAIKMKKQLYLLEALDKLREMTETLINFDLDTLDCEDALMEITNSVDNAKAKLQTAINIVDLKKLEDQENAAAATIKIKQEEKSTL